MPRWSCWGMFGWCEQCRTFGWYGLRRVFGWCGQCRWLGWHWSAVVPGGSAGQETGAGSCRLKGRKRQTAKAPPASTATATAALAQGKLKANSMQPANPRAAASLTSFSAVICDWRCGRCWLACRRLCWARLGFLGGSCWLLRIRFSKVSWCGGRSGCLGSPKARRHWEAPTISRQKEAKVSRLRVPTNSTKGTWLAASRASAARLRVRWRRWLWVLAAAVGVGVRSRCSDFSKGSSTPRQATVAVSRSSPLRRLKPPMSAAVTKGLLVAAR